MAATPRRVSVGLVLLMTLVMPCVRAEHAEDFSEFDDGADWSSGSLLGLQRHATVVQRGRQTNVQPGAALNDVSLLGLQRSARIVKASAPKEEISMPMKKEKFLGLESGAFLSAGDRRHRVEATVSAQASAHSASSAVL
uniref:Secreted protein n=1 Tax=Noctiluca scintillans TaxID=2966 RepID=A0A7S1F759_NOCSC